MTLAATLSSSMRDATEAAQTAGLEQTLGSWHSTEQFDGEARVQFAFRRQGNEVAILPEDEGTIAWEMRPLAGGKGVLAAVTENGAPFPEPIVWDVLR